MANLSDIERKRRIILPELYKKFYERCSISIPNKLVGSDLINKYPELQNAAIELLKENKVENFLIEDDFVFLMHQGYIFYYFKADGTPDPIVYGYHEQKVIPENKGLLSEFIKGYL